MPRQGAAAQGPGGKRLGRAQRHRAIRPRIRIRVRGLAPTRNQRIVVASADMVAIVRALFPTGSPLSMTSARHDVLGIGNAIVDVLARTDDDFLVRQNMRKGAMTLIDEERATSIYEA